MELKPFLEKAVREGDVSAVRAAILTYMDSDYFDGTALAARAAEEAGGRLEKQGKTLFDKDNGYYDISRSAWDKEVWHKIKAALLLNFSREKVECVTRMVEDYNRSRPKEEKRPSGSGAGSSGRGGGANRGAWKKAAAGGGILATILALIAFLRKKCSGK